MSRRQTRRCSSVHILEGRLLLMIKKSPSHEIFLRRNEVVIEATVPDRNAGSEMINIIDNSPEMTSINGTFTYVAFMID